MRSTPTCNEVTCPTAWSSTPSGSGCWTAVEVSYLLYYHKVMAQREKRSVSLPPDLARAVEQAAKAEGTTFSAWLAQTAAHRLRLEAGRQAIAEWERENGPLTEAELADGLARARSSLGRAPADPAGSWEWPTSRLFRCRNTVNAEIRTVRGSPGPQRRGRERLTPCGLRPQGAAGAGGFELGAWPPPGGADHYWRHHFQAAEQPGHARTTLPTGDVAPSSTGRIGLSHPVARSARRSVISRRTAPITYALTASITGVTVSTSMPPSAATTASPLARACGSPH